MWLYEQSSGKLIQGSIIGHGYSGCGEGLNSPTHEAIPNVGPIPCGIYRIGQPFDSPDHGPYCLPLTPDAANDMYGRNSFLIHGDSIDKPGTASKGCIIQSRAIRELIGASTDRGLEVVATIGKDAA